MLSPLTRLSNCISPISWAFMHVATFVPMMVILRPTLKEFLILYVIDMASYYVNRTFEGPIFKKLNPDTKPYFDGITENQVAKLSAEDQVKLFESFLTFPRRRAAYCALGSFIKVIPGILVIVFVWDHNISNWSQFWTILSLTAISCSYFYGAVFIEGHVFLSNLARRIHDSIGWHQVFRTARLSKPNSDFEFQLTLTLASIAAFMWILQWSIVTSGIFQDLSHTALGVLLTGIATFALLCRILYLNQKFFMGGLKDLFSLMNSIDYKKTDLVLPLHTTEVLAHFEKSFNLLLDRLALSEQEISSWIFNEAEKSRFRILGEISGLIAHDLANPIHVASFCAAQIQADSNHLKIKNEQYYHHLTVNLNRARELIESLRARLKDEDTSHSDSIQFIQAHEHVVRILQTQFEKERFSSIQFDLDPALNNVHLPVSQTDMIHILDNLYRNSIENFITNKHSSPTIRVQHMHHISENEINLVIQDNGTGLTAEQFAQLTAYAFASPHPGKRKGLGLRLTRRLIELRGGDLSILPTTQKSGTAFRLRFPTSKTMQL